jgi:hypothetical protein
MRYNTMQCWGARFGEPGAFIDSRSRKEKLLGVEAVRPIYRELEPVKNLKMDPRSRKPGVKEPVAGKRNLKTARRRGLF